MVRQALIDPAGPFSGDLGQVAGKSRSEDPVTCTESSSGSMRIDWSCIKPVMH